MSSPDPAALADYAQRHGVDVIVVDRALVEHGQLPDRWATVVPEAVARARSMLARQPSALQRRAAACTLHRGELVLLDARCLASGSGGPI